MRWVSIGSMVLMALGSACSDDGVPALSTDGGDTAATSGGSDMASASAGESQSGSMTSPATDTADPTTGPTNATEGGTTGSTTDQGSGSTFGSDSTGPGSTGPDTDTDTDTDTGSSSSSGSDTGSSSITGLGDAEIGDDCIADNECSTGVCWDWSDYDPFCGGAVCSISCMGDDECVEAFEAAGATNPDAVMCGMDDRCIPLGSGFGAFFCA